MGKRLPPKVREEIIQEFRDSKITSVRMLAEKYGYAKCTIRRILRKAGLIIKARRRLFPPSVKIPTEKWKIAYLAGVIDGDGSVILVEDKRRKRSKTFLGLEPRVYIDNSSEELMK